MTISSLKFKAIVLSAGLIWGTAALPARAAPAPAMNPKQALPNRAADPAAPVENQAVGALPAPGAASASDAPDTDAVDAPEREAALPVPPPTPEAPPAVEAPDAPGTPVAPEPTFDLPPGPPDGHDGLIGAMRVHIARHEDTLPDLAVQYDVGFVELQAANPGVDTWLPGAGTPIVIPTAHLLPDAPHKGIVLNIPEMRIYFYAPDGAVHTYPVGIGREGWATPVGATRVMRKAKNPVWHPPASIRAEKPWLPVSVPSSPDNPLGFRAMYLGWSGYLMHGTNIPYGVGRRASHGCIRLYESDVERLYEHVPVGTPVTSVNEETKAAWIGGQLYIEVHPSTEQAVEIETGAPVKRVLPPDLVSAIVKATPDGADIDWKAAQQAGLERRGYPVRVTR